MFCNNCGNQIPDDSKFCQGCGTQMNGTPNPTVINATKIDINNVPNNVEEKEVEYYKGEATLVLKKTEHRGGARKTLSLLGGPVGYALIGKDKTKKTKAEGTLVITNKAIYCAGNDFPFDRILSITKGGRFSKSIELTFEQDVHAGGHSEGPDSRGLSIQMEIKSKDIDGIFKGLENAKMHKLNS